MPLARLARTLAAVLVAGCGSQTGIILEVAGPEAASSVEAGVKSLAFVASRETWCERMVSDSTSAAHVDVAGRDLSAQPYSLLVKPAHVIDLDQPVQLTALALGDNNRLVGFADFGAHPFELKRINRFREPLVLVPASAPPVVTSDGCICAPGFPRVGNGSRTGCDLDVVPSRARWSDTSGCELGPMSQQLAQPVCDGQDWGDEAGRALPCVATKSNACRLTSRICHDRDGIGFETACQPEADAPEVAGALCDAYRACEANPCGDIQACFRARGPRRATPLLCKLHLKAEGGVIDFCGGSRTADLAAATATNVCPVALIDGQSAPPLTLSVAGGGEVVASSCPARLTVDAIDTAALTSTNASEVRFDLLLGAELVEVRVTIARGCDLNVPAFECIL